jgi:hypothetical protein
MAYTPIHGYAFPPLFLEIIRLPVPLELRWDQKRETTKTQWVRNHGAETSSRELRCLEDIRKSERLGLCPQDETKLHFG